MIQLNSNFHSSVIIINPAWGQNGAEQPKAVLTNFIKTIVFSVAFLPTHCMENSFCLFSLLERAAKQTTKAASLNTRCFLKFFLNNLQENLFVCLLSSKQTDRNDKKTICFHDKLETVYLM